MLTENDAVRAQRDLLRHTVATVAYRCGKTLRHAPESFPGFSAGPETRTPGTLLAHIGDLFEWALAMASGNPGWHDSVPLVWDDEVARFYRGLGAFDAYLASGAPLHASIEKLFQGPIADALTHTGQLAMLRRLAGGAIKGENYYVAGVSAGRVGPDQPAPKVEFD